MNLSSLSELVSWMNGTGQIKSLAASSIAQFGDPAAPLLGASLLPERILTDNVAKEGQLYIGGEIGQSGADYSPAQLNQGFGAAEESFVLGKLDSASQLVGPDIEAIINNVLPQISTTDVRATSAAEILARWIDRVILYGLSTVEEQQRWQAIVDKIVKRRGSNNYTEDVVYPTAPGSVLTVAASGTIAAPAGWYSRDPVTAADALEDILAMQQYFADRGYTLNRIISKSSIRTVFLRNGKVRQAALVPGTERAPTPADLQALMNAYGLPNWEVYDQTFRYREPANATGFARRAYLDRATYDPVILLAQTSLSEQIRVERSDTALGTIELPNTLGYFGLGRPPGQTQFGKVMNLVVYDEKYPPSIYAEVIAQGLPIIQDKEAIAIIKVPKPTP